MTGSSVGWLDFWRTRTKPSVSAIGFPNPSRSFDARRLGVRFWGSDEALEAAFFIGGNALLRLQPGMSLDEPTCLHVFDSHREKILGIAAGLYRRGYNGIHELQASDI